jgi:hypothetical protein
VLEPVMLATDKKDIIHKMVYYQIKQHLLSTSMDTTDQLTDERIQMVKDRLKEIGTESIKMILND